MWGARHSHICFRGLLSPWLVSIWTRGHQGHHREATQTTSCLWMPGGNQHIRHCLASTELSHTEQPRTGRIHRCLVLKCNQFTLCTFLMSVMISGAEKHSQSRVTISHVESSEKYRWTRNVRAGKMTEKETQRFFLKRTLEPLSEELHPSPCHWESSVLLAESETYCLKWGWDFFKEV